MKSLIVYYSYEGSTDVVANLIEEEINGTLLRLKLKKEKEIKSFLKYALGGKAIMNEKPELEPININIADYDLIFIGTPIWAFTNAPAINTFISETKIENKNIALFCTSGGSRGKTFEKLRKNLPNNNFVGENEFALVYKKEKEELKNEVKEWLKDIVK